MKNYFNIEKKHWESINNRSNILFSENLRNKGYQIIFHDNAWNVYGRDYFKVNDADYLDRFTAVEIATYLISSMEEVLNPGWFVPPKWLII